MIEATARRAGAFIGTIRDSVERMNHTKTLTVKIGHDISGFFNKFLEKPIMLNEWLKIPARVESATFPALCAA